MNLAKVLSLTKLPRFVTKPTLSERSNTLVAVLGDNDLEKPPAFLDVVKDNTPMIEELKKRRTVTLYGRNDEMFKYCHLACENLKNNYKSLSVGAAVARNLLKNKLTEASLFFPENTSNDHIAQFLNGLCLANYKFEKKEAPKEGQNKCRFKQLENINIYHPTFNPEDANSKWIIQSAKYALFCREVLNTRANEANTEAMLELCKELAKVDPNIKIEYLVGEELVNKGMNLIHEVGKGGPNRSSLVCLKYEGNPEDKDNVIALVGKGVTFDTGGMNLKPSGGIENMHYDKGGACTVLAAFLGAVEMKLPVNVVCSVVFVENSMSDRAVHPKDIITSYKGLTVEIGNTDAEGRLILADTMTYTQEKYKPKTMLEFSTLTGAIKVALGNETAGIFSNSDGLAHELYNVGQESCESFWRLPINEEHREDVRSNIADLCNKPRNMAGGSSKAAAFLEHFVDRDVKWAHIDIAGTSFREGEKFVYNSGATGHGVKMLLNYLKKQGQNAKTQAQA